MDLEGRTRPTPRSERRPVTLNPFINLRLWLSDHRGLFWQRKPGAAFWKVATLLSLTINLGLVVALALLARQVFLLKTAVAEPLVSGLVEGFVQMDRAHIRTTITVQDEIPVTFDLPVQQDTVVVLSQPARIEGATVTIRSGVLGIFDAPATVTLPAGTQLPIRLDMTVPVETTVPVELTVPVDIPLEETELHAPFTWLQSLFTPYRAWLAAMPDCWEEAAWDRPCR